MSDLPGGDAAPEEDIPVLQRSRRVRGVQAQVQYSAVQVQYSTVQTQAGLLPLLPPAVQRGHRHQEHPRRDHQLRPLPLQRRQRVLVCQVKTIAFKNIFPPNFSD